MRNKHCDALCGSVRADTHAEGPLDGAGFQHLPYRYDAGSLPALRLTSKRSE